MSHALPVNLRYFHQVPPTPLVAVQLEDTLIPIWCKLEFLNPSGSTKDRIARYILEKAWRRGELQGSQTVIEASSGSTSIAFALACAQMGLHFIAVMPEGVSNERSLMIRAFGGEVVLSPRELGIRGAIAETERIAREREGFLPRQFANKDNVEAHRFGTAREILDQLPGATVDYVVSGVGTGGTLVGLYQGLMERGCSVVPVVARPVTVHWEADVECCSFSASIPGVVDSVSTLFREAEFENLITLEVGEREALETTRRLHRYGFPVGPSSGLNYAAARQIAQQCEGQEVRIVTVFPDRMERYFTTELFRACSSGEEGEQPC